MTDDSKLRIAFLGAWPPDKVGEARYDLDLVNMLLKTSKHLEVDLACEKLKSVPEPIVHERLRVHHVFNPRDLLYPIKLFIRFLSWRPHLVHIQFGPNNKQYGGLLGEPMLALLLLLKLARIPTTLTLHTAFLRAQARSAAAMRFRSGKIVAMTPFVFLLFTKALNALVTTLQLNSGRMNSRLRQLFLKDYRLPSTKILEIPHPCFPGEVIPVIEARRALDIDEKVFFIFNFGFIGKRKGLVYLVKAAAVLKSQLGITDFQMLITGELENSREAPYLEELRSVIKNYNISSHVTIIPEFISQELLTKYQSAADVFIFPYIYTAGVSGAMHSVIVQGKPIIATNNSFQFKESVNRSLVLVPPMDENEIARKIKALKEDPAYYKEVSNAYKAFYLENNLSAFARRVLSYYIITLKWRG